jgi:lipopolysaccharide transport system ATP-binding protein
MMSVIEIEHLYKSFRIPHEKRITLFETMTGIFKPTSYETFDALKDINFSVEGGEAIGIIGENGSGKSTLLKIMAHILAPTEGKVNVNKKVTPFLELGVGFHPEMTAVENIKIYGTIMGMSKKEIRSRTDDILDFAGLEKFRDTKLRNFSSGMQVRLAFSTAIQTDPEILLLDEVLAVGDMDFQQKCLNVLNTYREEGVTIVFVSHDLGAVRRFCDRTLLLNHGEQVAIGETNRIIDKYVYGSGLNAKYSETIIENYNDIENLSQKSKSENSITHKKIEISDVRFIDKNGNYSYKFLSHDSMTVRVFYKCHENIASAAFGIAIYVSNVHVFGTSTKHRNFKLNIECPEGFIDFTVNNLTLNEGKYELTAAIASDDLRTQYDWHDRLYFFNIQRSNDDEGLLLLDGYWSEK